MVRTILTQTVLAEPEASSPGVAVTMTAADVANGNRFALNGNQILIAQNTDVSPHNVTPTSGLLKGRSKTLSAIPIAAGAIYAFPRYPVEGWRQASDGYFYISADDASIKFGVLNLQNQPNA